MLDHCAHADAASNSTDHTENSIAPLLLPRSGSSKPPSTDLARITNPSKGAQRASELGSSGGATIFWPLSNQTLAGVGMCRSKIANSVATSASRQPRPHMHTRPTTTAKRLAARERKEP